MPAPTTVNDFLDLVRKSGVVDDKKLDAYLDKLRAAQALPARPAEVAGLMIKDGILTHFQAEQFLLGKWRRFTIGKYRVLERLGSGGMGSVYLCEHKLMRRRVAVKVLPTAKAEDDAALQRFYREARAVAALDHPNIVRAYDIDQDDKLHFLVMEYVDGASLQEIVKKSGPMGVVRACHYIRQSALGLQHAHEAAALVHRDIKPGNILVDRTGLVKVLDMGLARFFNDEEDNITKKYDENVLGTADYLAPEQALNSHDVDIRADIYSLGATFYFCLTGKTPFHEGTVAQKLIWHQTRQPKPIRTVRSDVPQPLVGIIEKMMAKEPGQRYQTPAQVAAALEVFTGDTIAPPPDTEMPRLSPAAMGPTTQPDASSPPRGTSSSPASPGPQRTWQVTPPPPSSKPRVPGASPKPASEVSPTAPTQPTRKPGLSAQVPARAGSPRTSGRPVSAPNGTAATPAPDVLPEDENVSWEKMVADTIAPTAKIDTDPKSEKKKAAERKPSPAKAEAGSGGSKWLWILGIAAIVGLLVIGGGLWWIVSLLGLFGGAPSTADKGPLGRDVVHLSWKGAGDAPSWSEAVKKVRPGGKILIVDDEVTEPLKFGDNPSFLKPKKGITIEPASGKTVRWLSRKSGSGRLVELYKVEEVTIRGLILDGENNVEELVSISHLCPGVTLDNLILKGYKRCGILVALASGEEGRPIRIENSTFTPGVENAVGVRFQAKGSLGGVAGVQHLLFQSCTFEGTPFELDKVLDKVTIGPETF